MVLKIKKQNIINSIMISFIFMYFFILNWFGFLFFFDLLFICMFLMSAIITKRMHGGLSIVLLMIFPIYMMFNIIIKGGQYKIALSNGLHLFTGVCIVCYFSYLLSSKKTFLKYYLLSMWKIINGYMLINFPIMVMQYFGMTSLAGLHSGPANPYIPDLMSGLLGYSGTHWLALFIVFITMYNTWYYSIEGRFFSRIKKVMYWLYCSFVFCFNMFYSTLNDNKVVFILVPLFGVYYYYRMNNVYHNNISFSLYKSSIIKYVKVFSLISFVIICYNLLYNYTDFKVSVDKMLMGVINGLDYTKVIGGGERVGIIAFYVFVVSDHILGYGLGYSPFYSPNLFGFVHFGLNDLGSFLCIGGYLLVIVIYIIYIFSLWYEFRGWIDKIYISFILIFLLFYTMILSHPSGVIGLMLNVSLLALVKKKEI